MKEDIKKWIQKAENDLKVAKNEIKTEDPANYAKLPLREEALRIATKHGGT